MLGQIASIMGMVLTILSFQMKSRGQILIFQTFGSACFLLSFLWQREMTAVVLNCIFLARNLIFYFGRNKKWAGHWIWLPILLCAVTVAGIFSFEKWLDILPVIGSLFGTVAMYMKNENMMRLLKLGDSPCWLIFNCTVDNPADNIGAILCEVFNIASIIVGLIRYKKDGLTVKKA